ncbi:MAG: dTDP-4-dehydrorhamnose reductase [Actinobacteria bacterium]|nr:dTDP-4-dehydrorhamnose reductase [Actinomycetota bacterium]
MRLVVTGAGGGLGTAFLSAVPGHHDVHAFTRAALDVGDHHAVMQTVVPLRPDAILNFAAMTAVDACESDPEQAYRINALGPQSLALAARECGAAVVHVSTDYVFDGLKGAPYDELDAPNPLSTYARSKLGGEDLVRRLAPEHIVVRTSWVFGSGRDFLSRALSALSAGEPVRAVADRVGSPTYVPHLAERILPLLLAGRWGTYHVAGPEPATWAEVLHRVRALGGLPGRVEEVGDGELGLSAVRPPYSALTSVFTPLVGLPSLPPLDAALKEMLDARGG